jgi:hypothetical protein
MNFADILKSKPHNSRQMDRYIRFIKSRSSNGGYVEKHHICPKAKSLFPEYKSFKEFPWNRIELSAREHFIAHLLLWKAYGGSQTVAITRMIHAGSAKIPGSRMYAKLREDFSKEISKINKGRPKPPRSAEHIKNLSKPRVKKWSEESRQRAADAKKGITFSQEHRDGIAKARLGKLHSEKAKRNMAAAQLGSKATEETKAKMRESQRLAWQKRRVGA